MCGMLGSFNAAKFDVAGHLELIRHRGPDGSGIKACGPAVHGHVRLSLLDPTDAAAQPLQKGDGLLSFVGEIWNYRSLRAELEEAGYTFCSTGDTEVLAAALDAWGEEALPRLEGMFTLAWSKGGTHFLARDRFGKVPLYVARYRGGFVWSSERKGLDKGAMATPLPPASLLHLTTEKIHRWYTLPAQASSNRCLADLIDDGITLRINADAPLCCLISGGLDSSLILTLAKRHRPDIIAYTAVLDGKSTDLKAARRLCSELQVQLVEVRVPRPTPAALADAVRAIEIPSKAQIEIAALCLPLAQAIASDGFKACLSGEAADELFGGYGNMCIKGSSADDAGWRDIRVQQLGKMARGNFVRCNKAFMAYGVECRLPFMDRPLVETALAMPKAISPPGKKALKQAARGIIADWVINRTKETFQGASGLATAAAASVADPAAFYRAETLRQFGPAAKE